MSTYESARRQCRTLESLLDSKLNSYSRIASSILQKSDLESGFASERKQDIENEIEDIIEKLKEANDQLFESVNGPDGTPSSLHAVQRHREVWQGYNTDFQRTKQNVQSAFDQANLISNVRNDIDAYKSSTADALLSERGRIDSSHQMTDNIIAQAYETRAEFGRQSNTMSGINTRIGGVLNQIPGIDSVIGMIRSRRRRDALILGCTIAFCTILLLGYMTR